MQPCWLNSDGVNILPAVPSETSNIYACFSFVVFRLHKVSVSFLLSGQRRLLRFLHHVMMTKEAKTAGEERFIR